MNYDSDELENFLSTEMSKRKPMEDLKDVKTGKITIFFSKERTETKERTVTGKSKPFITKFSLRTLPYDQLMARSMNSLVYPK